MSITTLSLAREALNNARIEHARAQADNLKYRSMATKGILGRRELALAAAERGLAMARLNADRDRVRARV